jgi:hypothetical protein
VRAVDNGATSLRTHNRLRIEFRAHTAPAQWLASRRRPDRRMIAF